MRKTIRMQLMETQHQGRDIRDVMREAYRETGSRERAAVKLGLSRVTFVAWESLLEINVADAQEPATV